jgi:hypothetical protein
MTLERFMMGISSQTAIERHVDGLEVVVHAELAWVCFTIYAGLDERKRTASYTSSLSITIPDIPLVVTEITQTWTFTRELKRRLKR